MGVLAEITVHLVDELPEHGEHPGDLVVLHIDNQSPVLYKWDHIQKVWAVV